MSKHVAVTVLALMVGVFGCGAVSAHDAGFSSAIMWASHNNTATNNASVAKVSRTVSKSEVRPIFRLSVSEPQPVSALTLPAGACEFSAVYFFGASNLDTGNFLNDPYWSAQPVAPVPANGYWKGRWQSGPVWADAFADRLGLSAKASAEGGTNYAFGAAGTSPHPGETPGAPGTPGHALYLSTQIDQALTDTSGTLNPEAIYVFEIGHNDVPIFGRTVGEAAVGGGVVITQMQRLRAAGASIFLVRLLGPGLDPYATPFNQAVLSGVDTLRADGATVYVVDAADFIFPYLTVDYLVTIGITHFAIDDTCRADASCQAAATAAAQNGEIHDHPYLFFDGVGPHWNHRVQADIAGHALAQIPACENVFVDGFESL